MFDVSVARIAQIQDRFFIMDDSLNTSCWRKTAEPGATPPEDVRSYVTEKGILETERSEGGSRMIGHVPVTVLTGHHS
jgi:hypothetical protein